MVQRINVDFSLLRTFLVVSMRVITSKLCLCQTFETDIFSFNIVSLELSKFLYNMYQKSVLFPCSTVFCGTDIV